MKGKLPSVRISSNEMDSCFRHSRQAHFVESDIAARQATDSAWQGAVVGASIDSCIQRRDLQYRVGLNGDQNEGYW